MAVGTGRKLDFFSHANALHLVQAKATTVFPNRPPPPSSMLMYVGGVELLSILLLYRSLSLFQR